MAYFNKTILAGNIGAEPEIRLFPQSGRKIATFSLATTRRYRDQNGEQKEMTYWHNIKIVGKSAETIEKLHLAKGTSMLIEGELTYSQWTDQSGTKHYKTEVVAISFQLIGAPRNASGNGSQGQNAGYSRTQSAQPQQPQIEGGWNEETGDDLPF